MAQFYMAPNSKEFTILAFGIKKDTPAIDSDFEAERIRKYLEEYFLKSVNGSRRKISYLVNDEGEYPAINIEDNFFNSKNDLIKITENLGVIKNINPQRLVYFLGNKRVKQLTYAHLIESPTKLASLHLEEAIANHICSDLDASKWVPDMKTLDTLIKSLRAN